MENLLIYYLSKSSNGMSIIYIGIFLIIVIALGIIVNKQEKNK